MLPKQKVSPTITVIRQPESWAKSPTDSSGSGAQHVSPSVAVVIPAWNRLDDTLTCLKSLFEAQYPNLCVIIVDNGSDEGFAEAIVTSFPEVAIVRSSVNLGF